jgi:hypothetical protein
LTHFPFSFKVTNWPFLEFRFLYPRILQTGCVVRFPLHALPLCLSFTSGNKRVTSVVIFLVSLQTISTNSPPPP